MAGRSYGGLRRTAAVLACLVTSAAVLTGPPASTKVTAGPLRVLQMNLCNSGLAGCYTGRSVAQAVVLIRRERPDVVTLNEICERDVDALGDALRGVHRDGRVVRVFKAAPDRPSASATRCLDGQPYGIGLLTHLPEPSRGHTTHSGVYPTQDLRDPEERVWLCVHAGARFHACTTHLASTSAAVAVAQCGYLLGTAIPAIRSRHGYAPTVVGGDLNLATGRSPDVRSCLPPGHPHVDDDAVQHVVATRDFTVRSSRSIGMNGTTDHPSLLVALTIRPAADRVRRS